VRLIRARDRHLLKLRRMKLSLMTSKEMPPLQTLSGAVLEAQWDRVGHMTLSDRCRMPMGREKKKKPRCPIVGTRTILSSAKGGAYGARPKNETSRFFLFFSAHWSSSTFR